MCVYLSCLLLLLLLLLMMMMMMMTTPAVAAAAATTSTGAPKGAALNFEELRIVTIEGKAHLPVE